MTDLLTEAEHEALAITAALAERLPPIFGNGPTTGIDLTVAWNHIHAVQRMILAQAAARAYPDRYRLLGGVDAHVPKPAPADAGVRTYADRTGTYADRTAGS
jgi:hypothetical protein